MDIDKLIITATDSICLNPKLDVFKQIGKIFNSRPTSAKQLAPLLKKRLKNRHPRTQLLTLELIEYLTCVSWQQVHNTFHELDFLTGINVILNNSGADEVKQKVLYLIQFWADFFRHDKDVFPNFQMMFDRASSAGVNFDNFRSSQYSTMANVSENVFEHEILGRDVLLNQFFTQPIDF